MFLSQQNNTFYHQKKNLLQSNITFDLEQMMNAIRLLLMPIWVGQSGHDMVLPFAINVQILFGIAFFNKTKPF